MPEDYVRCLAKMVRWRAQSDYRNLDEIIADLRKTNAMEESPAQCRLLNIDGTDTLPE